MQVSSVLLITKPKRGLGGVDIYLVHLLLNVLLVVQKHRADGSLCPFQRLPCLSKPTIQWSLKLLLVVLAYKISTWFLTGKIKFFLWNGLHGNETFKVFILGNDLDFLENNLWRLWSNSLSQQHGYERALRIYIYELERAFLSIFFHVTKENSEYPIRVLFQNIYNDFQGLCHSCHSFFLSFFFPLCFSRKNNLEGVKGKNK